MIKNLSFLFLCIAIYISMLSLPAHGGNRDTIKEYQSNIEQIKQEVEQQINQINQTTYKETKVLEELAKLDRLVLEQKQKLHNLKKKVRYQEKLIGKKNQELILSKKKKEQAHKQMEARLRAYYVMGKTGVLNIAFAQKPLPDLIVFHDNYKELMQYDKDIISAYRKNIILFNDIIRASQQEKLILEDMIEEQKTEQAKLMSAWQKKQQLLARIRQNKSLYQQAINEMKQAESQLNQAILNLQEEDRKIREGFKLAKGKMKLPVKGTVSVKFGEKTKNSPRCRGIFIKTDEGAEVSTIYPGIVLFADYKEGYGNMVIIDHGEEYYSITSRLDTIEVEKDQELDANQIIGTTGDLATLFTPGLYFELRHKGKILDPLDWLTTQ